MINPLGGLPAAIRDSCVLAVIPATGTLKDWATGVVVSSSGVTWTRSKGRQALACVNSSVSAAANAAMDVSTLSLFMSGDFSRSGFAADFLFSKSGAGWRFYLDAANQMRTYDGSLVSHLAYADATKKRSLGCVSVAGAAPEFYGDGVYLGVGDDVQTFASTSSIMTLCSNTFDMDLESALMFDRALTTAEMAQVHTFATNLKSPSRSWPGYGDGNLSRPSRVATGNQKTASGECIGSWDLGDMANGVIADRSGNGNDGTVSGNVQKVSTSVGSAAKFDGSTGYVQSTASNLPTAYPCTLVSTCKIPNGVSTNGIFGLWDVSAASIYVNLFHSFGKFYGRVSNPASESVATSTDTFDDSVPHRVVCVFRSASDYEIYVDGESEGTGGGAIAFPTALDAISVGRFSDASPNFYLDGVVKDSAAYNYAWSEAQIGEDYADFAKLLTYDDGSEAWRVSLADEGGVVGQTISNTGWRCGEPTGRWRVIDDPSVEGGRCIECQTAGRLYKSIDPADNFGSVLVDLYKDLGASETIIQVCADDRGALHSANNNYNVAILSDESIVVRRRGVVVVTSAAAAASLQTWYRVAATRTADSLWSLYVDGASTGTPAVDNTYTGLLYATVDLDAGDRFANFRRYNGIYLTP